MISKIIMTHITTFENSINILKEFNISLNENFIYDEKDNLNILCFRIEDNVINGYGDLEFYELNFNEYTFINFNNFSRKHKLKKLI